MDISKAVTEFVTCSRNIFGLLRSEGSNISKLDLHILRTQLFILQVEIRSLDPLRFTVRPLNDEGNETIASQSPCISAMAAYLRVGNRLRAMRDHYPARAGATGCIRCFKGMPENWYVVVEWENPMKNFSQEKTTHVWPISLNHFEVVPDSVEGVVDGI
jgi:hypothetical protein